MRELNLHWNLIIVLAVAAGLRFYNLGQIPSPIFDEVFYPLFAINYLNGENFFSVHPPLGSYLITLSVFIFDIFPLAESLQIKQVHRRHQSDFFQMACCFVWRLPRLCRVPFVAGAIK